MFYSYILFKKENYPISAFVQSLFSTEKSAKVVNLPITDKSSVLVFDVTNKTNGFPNFESCHEVVIYLFNSLALRYFENTLKPLTETIFLS